MSPNITEKSDNNIGYDIQFSYFYLNSLNKKKDRPSSGLFSHDAVFPQSTSPFISH
ncbi:hypothetical protein STFR1_10338 [Bacillus vallismortis]